MADDQTRWMADFLATSIQVSGHSEEELELKLGWSAGSVRRLLEGESEPDPERILSVLSALSEKAPNAEWAAPLEERHRDEEERTQVVMDLVERFRRLGYESRETPPAGERVDAAELELRVSSVLRETFGDDE